MLDLHQSSEILLSTLEALGADCMKQQTSTVKTFCDCERFFSNFPCDALEIFHIFFIVDVLAQCELLEFSSDAEENLFCLLTSFLFSKR